MKGSVYTTMRTHSRKLLAAGLALLLVACGGFKKFFRGETYISDAPRPIKESERTTCAENGVEFFRVPVTSDGITVVAHPEND